MNKKAKVVYVFLVEGLHRFVIQLALQLLVVGNLADSLHKVLLHDELAFSTVRLKWQKLFTLITESFSYEIHHTKKHLPNRKQTSLCANVPQIGSIEIVRQLYH